MNSRKRVPTSAGERRRARGSSHRARTSPKRKGPTPSATEYPEGTRMLGRDGNWWVVKVNKKGVPRWARERSRSQSGGARGRAVDRLNQTQLNRLVQELGEFERVGKGAMIPDSVRKEMTKEIRRDAKNKLKSLRESQVKREEEKRQGVVFTGSPLD